MKDYIISQIMFVIIAVIITFLQKLVGSQSKFSSIVLWVFYGISFLVMAFMQGVIKGKYNLTDKQILLPSIVALGAYYYMVELTRAS